MTQLNVLCWNIQTLGNTNSYRTNQSRIGMITRTVENAQADIVCIQELMQSAITGQLLQSLQSALNALQPPMNNWYYEWIKGALTTGNRASNYPYNLAADLMWDDGHHEGYAVFWNQNIAKHIVQPAPPIQPPTLAAAPPPPMPPPPPAAANRQSSGAMMQGVAAIGGAPAPRSGMAVPAGGIVVPAAGGNPYTMPAGTVPPGGGAPSAAAVNMAGGAVVPAGTTIGPGGLTLAAATNGINPVVVPGGFVLTDALTLPPAGAVLVPDFSLGLVLFGRDSSTTTDPTRKPATAVANTAAADFIPAGANYWNWTYFVSGAGGTARLTGARRPAYITIKVNRTGFPAAADRLVPIIVYHAASSPTPARACMQRAAFSQPMYQAYDWTAGAWIACNNALLGGDFNVRMDTTSYAYKAYTDAFSVPGGNTGGAAATMLVANPAPPVGTMADNPLNKSIVSLTRGPGGPNRFSLERNYFRTLAIDNIFYRGLGMIVAGNSGLGNMLTACYGPRGEVPGTLTGLEIQNCVSVPNMRIAAGRRAMHRICVFPAMSNGITSLRDIEKGRMGYFADYSAKNTRARRTAEFVNLFVSDHLPVAVRFTL